ncbi:MAG: hypothetical protein LAO76_27250 [Acidobacteriia bacterium]|nr:hypothetical protein [Terriglobia bacterium]
MGACTAGVYETLPTMAVGSYLFLAPQTLGLKRMPIAEAAAIVAAAQGRGDLGEF